MDRATFNLLSLIGVDVVVERYKKMSVNTAEHR